MAVVSYSIAHIPVWKPRSFSQSELRDFGREASALMVNRIQRGINVRDLPAKPLSKPYAKQKTRAGKAAIRDWTFTGATLAALGIVELKDGSVAIGIDWRTNPRAFQIALVNQKIEQMVGLSPSDREKLRALIREAYRRAA